MTKKLINLLFTLAITLPLSAQNESVPDYLVQQDFPDSVKSLAMLNLNGQRVSFADAMKLHEGRKVVIDIWASWCRDCFAGLPKLNELKKKTSDEKVVYVFISVDEDEKKWRSAIKRFGIQGEHYIINTGWYNPLSNYIVLDWVPRYLILNEKGNIIMPKALTANEQLETTLIE
jgi:thiol-disulfide isomerase/thioredoxin